MAEGHAVVRQALRLAALVGEPLEAVEMPKRWGDRPLALVGARLLTPQTRGKHLLLPLSTGETPEAYLHTHGAQFGSWQVGERPLDYRKDEKAIRLHLATAAHEAVFYWGPTVELLSPDELAAHERLNALGPDVMGGRLEPGGPFDRAEAERRLAALGDVPAGSAVQDQKAAAGIGNIYATEGLFLAGVDPRRPAAGVTEAEWGRFWAAVQPMMWDGTTRYGRTVTVPQEMRARGERRWVYQRKGKPCLVCATPVELVRLPPYDRAAYLCPACQG